VFNFVMQESRETFPFKLGAIMLLQIKGQHAIRTVTNLGGIIVLNNGRRLQITSLLYKSKVLHWHAGDIVILKPNFGSEVTVEHKAANGMIERITATILA
jgi:hypothetical protein